MRQLRSFLVIALAACGGGNSEETPTIDASPGEVPSPDADNTGFSALIGRDWQLTGGTDDTYRCARVTVKQDTYVHAFRAEAPLGTHHTVVGITRDGRPDGVYDCSVTELGHRMVFASGINSPDLTFPDGVAVKLKAGTQLVLNLHLYNATEGSLKGPSSILIKTMPASEVKQEAESVFAGTTDIGIEGNNPKEQFADGECTAKSDFTLFALWPHMHQLGTKQLVTLTTPGQQPRVLHDKAYSFTEQKFYPQNPTIAVKAGDKIAVRCVYVNPGKNPVSFGESSDAEMCFTGLYRYPSSNANVFECAGGILGP